MSDTLENITAQFCSLHFQNSKKTILHLMILITVKYQTKITAMFNFITKSFGKTSEHSKKSDNSYYKAKTYLYDITFNRYKLFKFNYELWIYFNPLHISYKKLHFIDAMVATN